MRRQKGLTLSGFMTWAVIFAIAALVGFKLGPAYTEDMTIQKHFKAIANDATYSTGGRKEIENAFSSRAQVDRIEVISPKDIVISKEGGGISLSANYTVRVPLVHNISACMDFNPTSK